MREKGNLNGEGRPEQGSNVAVHEGHAPVGQTIAERVIQKSHYHVNVEMFTLDADRFAADFLEDDQNSRCQKKSDGGREIGRVAYADFHEHPCAGPDAQQ